MYLAISIERKRLKIYCGEHNNKKVIITHLGTISTLGSSPWFSSLQTDHTKCKKAIHENFESRPEIFMSKNNHLWLGKFKGFGAATFPKTVMLPLLAEAHLKQENKIRRSYDNCSFAYMSIHNPKTPNTSPDLINLEMRSLGAVYTRN